MEAMVGEEGAVGEVEVQEGGVALASQHQGEEGVEVVLLYLM